MLNDDIMKILRPILDMEKLELYDLVVSVIPGSGFIRVFIDKEGGVSVDDCALVSRHLGMELETMDVMVGKYNLEVSSPGLERELKREIDFKRALFHKVKVKLKEKIGKKSALSGLLKEYDDKKIIIETEKGKIKTLVEIEKRNINKIQMKIEF